MQPPPSGLPPAQLDFVYDAGMAQATVAFGAIMAAITTASVAVRLYTRYFITKQVRVDDAWALCAVVRPAAFFLFPHVRGGLCLYSV